MTFSDTSETDRMIAEAEHWHRFYIRQAAREFMTVEKYPEGSVERKACEVMGAALKHNADTWFAVAERHAQRAVLQ